jgi:hypothetical protein
MRKLVTLFCLLAFTTSAVASNFFFEKEVGPWLVLGHKGTKGEHNAICTLNRRGNEGEHFMLSQDLVNGEMIIDYRSGGGIEWEAGGTAFMRFTSEKEKEIVLSATFYIVDKTHIQIRYIEFDRLLPLFIKYDTLQVVFKGDAYFITDLKKTGDAVDAMINCIKKGKPYVKQAPFKVEPDEVKPKVNMSLPKVQS